MYGCQSCCDGTRFLCTACNLCCNCCPCGDGFRSSNGGNGNGDGSCGQQMSCQMPPMPPMPPVPNLPSMPCQPPQAQCNGNSQNGNGSNTNGQTQTPFNCPCAVLYSYGTDPCCGIQKTPDISHPCPWPWYKRVFIPGCPIVPGYQGHIPGYRLHGAGRTFGDATRDTCCIMGQWGNCCPLLPCRIFEQ